MWESWGYPLLSSAPQLFLAGGVSENHLNKALVMPVVVVVVVVKIK